MLCSAIMLNSTAFAVFGGLSVSSAALFSVGYEFDISSKVIMKLSTETPRTFDGLMAPAVAQWQGNFYVYGGIYFSSLPQSILWRINVTNGLTESFQLSFSDAPVVTNWGAYVTIEDTLFIVGGTNATLQEQSTMAHKDVDNIFVRGVVAIDLRQRSAALLPVQPGDPWRRQGAAMAPIRCPGDVRVICGLLFGGQGFQPSISDPYITFNDTWLWNTRSNRWQTVTVVGPSPPSRLGHSLVALSPVKVLLTGGKNNISIIQSILLPPFLQDVWAGEFLADHTFQWTQLEISNPVGMSITPAFASPETGKIAYVGGFITSTPGSQDMDLSNLILLAPGCNPGSQTRHFFNESCEPCPVGTFSAISGGTCQHCPDKTSTQATGAKSAADCNSCSDDNSFCSGHGECQVAYPTAGNPIFFCICHDIWVGRNCSYNIPVTVFLATLGLVLLFATQWGIRRWWRGRVRRFHEVC